MSSGTWGSSWHAEACCGDKGCACRGGVMGRGHRGMCPGTKQGVSVGPCGANRGGVGHVSLTWDALTPGDAVAHGTASGSGHALLLCPLPCGPMLPGMCSLAPPGECGAGGAPQTVVEMVSGHRTVGLGLQGMCHPHLPTSRGASSAVRWGVVSQPLLILGWGAPPSGDSPASPSSWHRKQGAEEQQGGLESAGEECS